jgi:hypothetical protein
MKLAPIGWLLLSACGGVAALPVTEAPSASRADNASSGLRRLVEDKLASRRNWLVPVPEGAKPPDAVMQELAVVNASKGPKEKVFFLEPSRESGVKGYVIEVIGASRDIYFNNYWLTSEVGVRLLHGVYKSELHFGVGWHSEWVWAPWGADTPRP